MTKIDLLDTARKLPQAWSSRVVGHPGASQLKVVRMDGAAYPAEVHDFDEALIVLEGKMNLEAEGRVMEVAAGEAFVVPAGLPHSVAPGSFGTLLIIDVAE